MQTANNPLKIKAMTGFDDGAPGGDLTKDLFVLVALLELYSSAYLDADCYFSKNQTESQTSAAGFMPRDRLLTYLQLVRSVKRGGRGRRNSSMMGDAASERTNSSGRFSERSSAQQQVNIKNLRHIDLSNPEDFFKLKGAVLDEHILRLILKNFRQQQEARVQEERMQTESALSQSKKMDQVVKDQVKTLQMQLKREKEKVANA